MLCAAWGRDGVPLGGAAVLGEHAFADIDAGDMLGVGDECASDEPCKKMKRKVKIRV